MADQYTPEEIAEIFEAYNNAIKTGTPISAELAKQMQDATKGFRGATDALNKFGKSLGTSALDLGKSLYKGEKGVGQFGDAVEMAANAIQIAILAIPGIGIAAKVATVAMVALAKGVNAAAKQGDALYKTYQDLGRAGATASDGISGVFRNMQNLGYGIEELDQMVALVSQNSETLAKFSLTAADGTNAFAEGMAQIQRDGGLRLLGKTTDDINSAGAAFIRQSVRAGISQKDIGDKLGAQTKAYVLELDRLQRLTGMSADALQKQQDEAMAEDAYNDVMSELKQRAAAGDEVAKMQIEKITTVMNKLGPEMRKEFVAGIGGDVSAQQRLFMAAPNLMKDTMDETADTQKTINNLNKDAANTVNTFGKTARLAAGAYRDTFGPLYEMRETMVSTADFDARTEAAKKNAQVVDKSTQNLTEAQIANMNSRDAMQAFIQKGVAPATTALAALAKGASKLTGAAAEVVGAPGMGAATGGAGKAGGGGGAGGLGGYEASIGGPSTLRRLGMAIGAVGAGPGAESGGGGGGGGAPAAVPGGGGGGAPAAVPPAPSGPEPHDSPVGAGGGGGGGGGKPQLVSVSSKTGKSAMVNSEYASKFQGVIDYLDSVGYNIYSLGGYVDRDVRGQPGRKSVHAHGGAIDINPAENPLGSQLITDMPAEIGKVAAQLGLGWGGNWRSVKDAMHFSVAQNEGGTIKLSDGGIATGPSSGYSATLHGTEAVVPLPNGKTIPVEMAGFGNNLSDQTGLMSQQLDKLDELIRVMQNQVSVSTKILQAAN
jgi:D-alanyl-D-alanine carboxypeptidase